MMEFGDIVFFKNLVFENLDGTHEIDHAFNIGRPCLYIGEFGDNMYFLPLTRLDDKRDRKFFDIVIEPNKTNKLLKKCKINYTTIIKKPIAFYEVKGYLEDKYIYEILEKSIILYNKNKFNNSKILLKIMNDYISKNNLIIENEKTTIKKKTKKRNNY